MESALIDNELLSHISKVLILDVLPVAVPARVRCEEDKRHSLVAAVVRQREDQPRGCGSSSQSLNSQITLAIIFRRGSSTSLRQSQATPRQNGSSKNTWNSAGVFLIMAGPDNIADFYKMPDFAQKVQALTVCLSLWRASNFRSSLSRKQISLFALASGVKKE